VTKDFSIFLCIIGLLIASVGALAFYYGGTTETVKEVTAWLWGEPIAWEWVEKPIENAELFRSGGIGGMVFGGGLFLLSLVCLLKGK
jgi:hypothetical protein